jgi:site-specific recombinase XerD
MVMQQNTGRPVQFEITPMTREAVQTWIKKADLGPSDHIFPSSASESPHLSTRQYARIVHHWVEDAGLETGFYGTHTMRRTEASLIYRQTRNLKAVQLLLGHTKLEIRRGTLGSK